MIAMKTAEVLCALIIPPGSEGEPSGADSRAPEYLMRKLEGRGPDSGLFRLVKDLEERGAVDEHRLKELEGSQPVLFTGLVRTVYEGYYSDPEVVSRLELPRSPQPGGHDMKPFDMSVLNKG